jgi:ABC-type multidrug transport system ATPase subunit
MEDSDVQAEDKRSAKETVVVKGLNKYYKNENDELIHAVKGISFGLNKGESFALLGVNGAGKSTTFKCLTLDEMLSSGEIKINNHTSS